MEKEKTNIVLIGMPGAGKSTIGVILAKVLGMSFVDTDLVIQERSKKLLRELIAAEGMEGFLKREEAVIASLSCSRCVIATGGSAVYGEKAMERQKEKGVIVFLSLPEELLLSRLGDLDERGVCHRKGQSFHDLYAERQLLYEKWAEITIGQESGALRIDETIGRLTKALYEAGFQRA